MSRLREFFRSDDFALAVVYPLGLVTGLYFVGTATRDSLLASRGVPTTCRILASDVTSHTPDKGPTTYAARVTFEHSVGGETYRIEDDGISSTMQDRAASDARDRPVGAIRACRRLPFPARIATVFDRDPYAGYVLAPAGFGVGLIALPFVVHVATRRAARRRAMGQRPRR